MINPVNADVTVISLKEDSYSDDENFTFVGTESEGAKSIFVIIRGSTGKYIGMLSDPVSDSDGSFETIPRPVDNFFKFSGTYNATAFADDQQESEGIFILLNYDGDRVTVIPNFVLELKKIGNKSVNEKETLSFTATATDSSLKDLEFKLDQNPPSGATIDSKTGLFSWTPTITQGPASYIFDIVVLKGPSEDRETITVTVSEPSVPAPPPEPTKNIPNFVDPKQGAQYYLDRYNDEPAYKDWFDTNYPDYTIQEAIELAIPNAFPEPDPPKELAPFVDPTQDPQYYIDRYNNEPTYKDWFDENFPDQTIYEAVGVEPPKTGICGTGTKFVNGVCMAVSQGGGGCLIATAAYGSEMSSQVQSLREIRDNTVLGTDSGHAFMDTFNSIYYSFSPTIADWERQSPIFKNLVQTTITPLLTTLSLLNAVEIDSEEEMLGYGIGIIFLNLGIYFVAPAITIIKVRKYLNN
jgi:hypothetical protein